MRYVQTATQRPAKCIFFPQIGADHEKGFIESNSLFSGIDPTSVQPDTPYVSVVALQEIADKIPEAGLCRRDDLTLAQAELEVLRNENADLKAQMAEYDKELDAIQILKARGYTPAKKPGRKPATK